MFSNGDTLFCYQRISNSIPFIRDRQYIFKMYRVDNSRIDWYLVNENHVALQPYLKDDVRTLTYGAGSWKFLDDEKILIYRMYMDEEVNLPLSFIQKLRVNYALNIFNDVINWSKGTILIFDILTILSLLSSIALFLLSIIKKLFPRPFIL